VKHRERRRESAPHARGPAFAIRPEPDAVERRFVLSGPGGIRRTGDSLRGRAAQPSSIIHPDSRDGFRAAARRRNP